MKLQHFQIIDQDSTNSSSPSMAKYHGDEKSLQHGITQQVKVQIEQSSLPVSATVQGGKSSVGSSIINLLNTVAGAGMLGLPAAYAGSGYIGGTIMMLLASFFSSNGLQLLCFSAEMAGAGPGAGAGAVATQLPSEAGAQAEIEIEIESESARVKHDSRNVNPARVPSVHYKASFYSVARSALPEFTMLIDFAVAIKCFGVATGYLITFADCMVNAFDYFLKHTESNEFSFFLSRHFWVIGALIFVFPISFFKTLDALKVTSSFSLLLIYSLAVGIVLYAQGILQPCPTEENLFFQQEGETGQDFFFVDSLSNSTEIPATCHGTTSLFSNPTKTISNLPIFVFSFTCHQNIFSIYNELSNRTPARLSKIISTSILSALFLYYTVAIEGYRTFGNHVSGDILLNYPEAIAVTIMRVGIAIMVVLSYPLQLNPSRQSVLSLVKEIKRIRNKRRKAALHEQRSREMQTVEVDRRSLLLTDSLYMDVLDDYRSSMSTSSTLTENFDESMDVSLSDMNMEAYQEDDIPDDILSHEDESEVTFYFVTCLFLLGTFIIAMIVSNLGIVLGVVGATGSTMVSYILPGAIYIKMHPEQRFWNHKWKRWAHIQLLLGFIIIPTALYFLLFDGV